eukprot:705927_1
MVSKMKSLSLFIVVFLTVVINAETLVYDGSITPPSIIECTDALTPCVIICTASHSCKDKEIHCHRTSPQPCTIYVHSPTSSGMASAGSRGSYYTHQAPTVNITSMFWYAMYASIIYAHEAMGSALYLSVDGGRAFEGSTIYAPVGEGSLLSMDCSGGSGCKNAKIYEDWTTEVHIDSRFSQPCNSIKIRNIFDDSPWPLHVNVSRNDSNYIGLNSAYRAPVFLTSMILPATGGSQSFLNFQYFGHNHGDWTLHATERRAFGNGYIEATSDIPPYNRSSGYDIKLIGTSLIDENNDALTADGIFHSFTLNASYGGANIYAKVTDLNGLTGATIYARDADSVQIYCIKGGECDGLMVECPENSKNDSTCTILCDDDAQTDCSNMKIYYGTCSQPDVLCDGDHCNFGVDLSVRTKLFCGFAQNESYCQMQYNASGTGDLSCQYYGSGSRSCTDLCTPSGNPTVPSTVPSGYPTVDPSANPSTPGGEREVTESRQSTESAGEDDSDRSNALTSPNEIVFIIIGSVVACALAVGFYIWIRRIMKRKKDEPGAELSKMPSNSIDGDGDAHVTDTKPTNTSCSDCGKSEGEMFFSSSDGSWRCVNCLRTEGDKSEGVPVAIVLDTRPMNTCVDCKFVKPGRIWESDGCFYCNECLMAYDDDSMYGDYHEAPTNGNVITKGTDSGMNTSDYLNWNWSDVCEWILSLEDGAYVEYKDDLYEKLREENVKGKDLKWVDVDAVSSWGVKQFGHKQLLVKKYIKGLIENGNCVMEGTMRTQT